jgi:hypothetical protein
MNISEQDAFDSIMLLITETISSEDFLESNGIFRSRPLNKTQWKSLISKINKQNNKTTVAPKITAGIYPKAFDGGTVHYFSIRPEPLTGKLTVANGYPNAGGFGSKFGRPLNAQPNNSHGLCQTFALMYHTHSENLLKPGKYQTNVIIGLEWLKNHFTQVHPWVLSYNDNIVSVVQAHAAPPSPLTANLKKLLGSPWPKSKLYIDKGKQYVPLHELVGWVLDPSAARRSLLQAWAADLGPDL